MYARPPHARLREGVSSARAYLACLACHTRAMRIYRARHAHISRAPCHGYASVCRVSRYQPLYPAIRNGAGAAARGAAPAVPYATERAAQHTHSGTRPLSAGCRPASRHPARSGTARARLDAYCPQRTYFKGAPRRVRHAILGEAGRHEPAVSRAACCPRHVLSATLFVLLVLVGHRREQCRAVVTSVAQSTLVVPRSPRRAVPRRGD